MSQMDTQWNALAKDILNNGWDEKPEEVRAKYETDKAPAPTKYVLDRNFVFDGTEAPIMKGKKINPIKPFHEIDWIMIEKSNVLADLHRRDVHFWDNWDQGDGTIGKAYGYQNQLKVYPFPILQVDKSLLHPDKPVVVDNGHMMLDQVDALMQQLKYNPRSRRLIIMLWNILHISEMKLPPCVYRSEWMVDGDDRVNIKVGTRSSDLALGVPFNVIQYFMFWQAICKIVGLEPGVMKFDMGNVHIYDRHFDGVNKILERKREDSEPSQLILPQNLTNLYELNVEDIIITNYDETQYSPYVPFEIAE